MCASHKVPRWSGVAAAAAVLLIRCCTAAAKLLLCSCYAAPALLHCICSCCTAAAALLLLYAALVVCFSVLRSERSNWMQPLAFHPAAATGRSRKVWKPSAPSHSGLLSPSHPAP